MSDNNYLGIIELGSINIKCVMTQYFQVAKTNIYYINS